jgi:hypothetical protein
MSVVVISVAPGAGAEQDAALMTALDLENNPPAGGRLRIAGPTDAGWRTITVWDSQEDCEAFVRDRLTPTFERFGRSVPESDVSPVASIVTLE